MHRFFLILVFGICSLRAETPEAPTYDWQARWDHYLERTYGWRRVGTVIGETAFEDVFRLEKCGRPPYCFPHHLGGALMRRTARSTIELGAGALLHEDIRRRPSELTGLRKRITFALLHAPLAKNQDGEWRPAYSRFAGTMGAVAVSDAWRGKPLNGTCLVKSFGWATTSYFSDALFTEFEPDLRRFAQRLWQKHIKAKRTP